MLRVTEEIAAAEPILEHGLDVSADAVMHAVHGLLLLDAAQRPENRRRIARIVERLRPTGVSFQRQLEWVRDRLDAGKLSTT
jgi:hypothetical protein